MKTLRTLVLFLTVVVGVAPSAAAQATLVVHHNANLRADHNTQSTITDHLEPGDEVTTVDPDKTTGFWHVRTVTGVDGWIYQTLVHVAEQDAVPTAPAPTAAIATEIDPTWAKPAPVGSSLAGPPGMPACPAAGEAGGDVETNRRKNRKDAPTSAHPVAFTAIKDLSYPDASTNRTHWSAAETAQIAPYEGVAVSVVGFIVAVKKQSGGGGEATNCHFNTTNFVDTHVALVEAAGQGEADAIVVEPTPRFYGAHPSWLFAKLQGLDHSADPVRISGWLLFDPVHKGHLGTYRATLWEIHPITKIEVFHNGQWQPW